MIRPAALTDYVALTDLVRKMHEGSAYPAREIGLSDTAVKAVFRDAIIRNGRTNEGGTLLNVVEVNGKLVGFMLGILQRVYLICNRLEAVDMFLYCAPEAPARAAERLIDRYIAWAEGNEKVAEITLSFTKSGGGNTKKLARLYERKGFEREGEIWKRTGL